jgi:hypothetical protein
MALGLCDEVKAGFGRLDRPASASAQPWHVRRVLLSARETKPALGVGETPLRSGEQVRAALTAPRLER